MRAAEYRKIIYSHIEKVIERKLTPEEHAGLKAIMQEYVREHGLSMLADGVIHMRTPKCPHCKKDIWTNGASAQK